MNSYDKLQRTVHNMFLSSADDVQQVLVEMSRQGKVNLDEASLTVLAPLVRSTIVASYQKSASSLASFKKELEAQDKK